MSKSPSFHPLSNMFPMMPEIELSTLTDDIKRNGLREKLTLLDDMILDGRNRFKACSRIGVKPDFETFNSRISPIDFVVSKNLHRRHLDVTDRAIAAMSYKQQIDSDGKYHEQQANSNGKKPCRGLNLTRSAEIFGVGVNLLDFLSHIKKHRQDLMEKVIAKKMTITKAYKETRGLVIKRNANGSIQPPKAFLSNSDAVVMIHKLLNEGWNFEMRIENGIFRAHFYGQNEIKPYPFWNMSAGFGSFQAAICDAAQIIATR